MTKSSRRRFIKAAGLGSIYTAARHPLAILVELIYASELKKAVAATGDNITPRNYVMIQLFGAPPRWAVDQPLVVSDADKALFVNNPSVATRFAGSGNIYDSLTYETTKLTINNKTLNMPWVWQFPIPVINGTGQTTNGSQNMSSLLNNALFIRGINIGFPDHPGACAAQFRPLGISSTLGGITADHANKLLPSINVDCREFTFLSKKGLASINLGVSDSPLDDLLSPFLYSNNGDDRSVRDLINSNQLEAAVNAAFTELDSAAKKVYKNFDFVNLASKSARSLVQQSFGNLQAEYDSAKARYQNLINASLNETTLFDGINNPNIGAVSNRGSEYDLSKEERVTAPTLRGCVKDINDLAAHFAITEYIIKNDLSSFVSINPNGTIFNAQSATGNGGESTRFDEHQTGAFPSTMIALSQGRALAACLRQFITTIGAEKYNNTIIQVGGEFGREPYQGGSDHGPNNGSMVIYSGAIDGPFVLGNIKKSVAGGRPGTWGHYAKNDCFETVFNDSVGVLGHSHIVSTVSTMLRIPSPLTVGNLSLVEEDASGKIKMRTGIEQGKIVVKVFKKYFSYFCVFCTVLACSNFNQKSHKSGTPQAEDNAKPEPKTPAEPDEKNKLPKKPDDPAPKDEYANLKCKREDCIKQIECQKLGANLGAPSSIDTFINFVNLLPKPLNSTCILAALPRPLAVHATSNLFSAQPPGGPESPRILIRLSNLILSFVPDGSGSKAIEVSEVTPEEDSIKGDIPLPIIAKLEKWSPYEHLNTNNFPSCASICHSSFREVKRYDNDVLQYASDFIKPFAASDVSLVQLHGFWEACIEYQNTALPRCEFYNALFEFGEVKAAEF